MKAELVPDNGDPPIPITRDVTVIGRREYCDVVIDDESLSKRHCVVVRTDGLLIIRDLATTNGTKVKGQRIRWAALLPDDRITLGAYKMRVYLGPDDAPAPSERDQGRRPSRAAAPAPPAPGAVPPSRATGLVPSAFPGHSPPPGSDDQELELIEDDESSWHNLTAGGRDDEDIIIELE